MPYQRGRCRRGHLRALAAGHRESLGPTMSAVNLAGLSDLSVACRESGTGFEGFRQDARVSSLGWPDDVVEQFLYDHAANGGFLVDYKDLDLSRTTWGVEVIPVEEFLVMPTGASDGGCMEEFAVDPDHWVRVRDRGVHVGVAECWRTRGTWKRWPILIERSLLDPPGSG